MLWRSFAENLKLRLFVAPPKMLFLFTLVLLVASGSFFASLPMRMAAAKLSHPDPQGILVLGGSPAREVLAANLARSVPQIPIWLSSGQTYKTSRQIFAQANVDWQRVNFDTRAVDTVTNFTSLVADFQAQDIRHLYLITSEYHMSRSSAIATIVLGSRGIAFTPVSVSEPREPEAQYRTVRDTIRSIIWLVTGRTGASLNPAR